MNWWDILWLHLKQTNIQTPYLWSYGVVFKKLYSWANIYSCGGDNMGWVSWYWIWCLWSHSRLTCRFVVVCIYYTSASVLIQHIYQDMDFKSPFLLTYLANSLLVLYLPLWQLWIACGYVKRGETGGSGSISTISKGSDCSDAEHIVNHLHEDAFSDVASIDENFVENDLNPIVIKKKTYTHMDVVRIAAIICPLWFMSNCLYNYSLLMTSVSSSTIIRYVCLFTIGTVLFLED